MRKRSRKSDSVPFYGRITWGNFFDWLVTLCLCALFIFVGVSLGSIRPETHCLLLPFFVLLLFFHGLWFVFEDASRARFSLVPIVFLPFLLWAGFSAFSLSPAPWRGWQDWIYYVEAFIFLWLLCNNGRSISHLWVICLSALIPVTVGVLIGFYQLFQDPNLVAIAWGAMPVEMSVDFIGRSTGLFADPHSFALFLLVAFTCLLFLGLATRLPVLQRILSLYGALVLFGCTVLTQVFWVYVGFAGMLLVMPWLVFKRTRKRVFWGLFTALGLVSLVALTIFLNPVVGEKAGHVWSLEGEGIRRVLWPEAATLTGENLILGVGSGAFGMMIEQSSRVSLVHAVQTPLNDALLISAELGLFGLFLLVLPIGFLLVGAWSALRKEPFVKYSGQTRTRLVMPTQRFFLSFALLGSIACLLGSFLQGVLLLPMLLFTGALFFGLLIKTSYNLQIVLPHHRLVRTGYVLFVLSVGIVFIDFALPILRARELELVYSQRLEEIVENKLHLSGNQSHLNEVINKYADGCLLHPENADLWIGRSQAVAQRYFGNPSLFIEIGEESLAYAQRAVEISPEYARAWSQLGLAHALSGNVEAAEEALLKGIELAPNSSNAHYYWASFASLFSNKMDSARQSALRAVEINPENIPAQQINRKLNIL